MSKHIIIGSALGLTATAVAGLFSYAFSPSDGIKPFLIVGIALSIGVLTFLIAFFASQASDKHRTIPLKEQHHAKATELQQKGATLYCAIDPSPNGYCGYSALMIALHMEGADLYREKVQYMLEALRCTTPHFASKKVEDYENDIKRNVRYPKENVFLLMKFLYFNGEFTAIPDAFREIMKTDLTSRKQTIDGWDNPDKMPTYISRTLWFDADSDGILASNLMQMKINIIGPNYTHDYNQDQSYPGPLQLKNTGAHWIVIGDPNKVTGYEQQYPREKAQFKPI